MNEHRTVAIYHSIIRPDLLAGCERIPLLTVGLMTLTLTVVAFNSLSFVAGFCLWFLAFYILKKMAKHDPILSKIYWRHIRYASFYPAKSTPYALSASHKR